MPPYVPITDLDEITQSCDHLQADLKNAKIFLTGGTGFFGIWFIESFLALNRHYALNATLTILSRSPARFLKRFPELDSQKGLHFITGDVQHFDCPVDEITHVIHAATPADNTLIENEPFNMLDIIIGGTKQIFEFCLNQVTKPKVLLVSSGAVYGRQDPLVSHIAETAPTSPQLYHRQGAYAVGKCMAEHLAFQYNRLYDLPIKIARCFAFIGPYLPLDAHYAIGNFLANALAQQPITIKANHPVFRSYQYPTDLMVWLWTILIHGKSATPYNIGSDEDYTLTDFAEMIAQNSTPAVPVHSNKHKTGLASRYVPSIDFAKHTLGLYNSVNIHAAIKRTIQWHQR